MLELIQITNDPVFAQRCDALGGIRLWVDLERLGKAQRQTGHNTVISTHELDDVGRVKAVLRHSRLMVRVNPLHPGTAQELEAVLAQGADMVMLPMFQDARELETFCDMVGGRVPVVALLETAGALRTLDTWLATPGLSEVYVGLNDLHLSLGLRFMFEPLANGEIDRVANAVHGNGLAFGFGGVARLNEGLLPGRDVLAEHVRLESTAVILSRTFHGSHDGVFEDEVAALRDAQHRLAGRSPQETEADRMRIAARILEIAGGAA
jgi:hypothetical protein